MRRDKTLLVALKTHIDMARRVKTLLVTSNIHIDVVRRDKTLLAMPNSEHPYRRGQEG